MSILLLWQALGWIAFGYLEPIISQRVGQPANSGLILTVAFVMAALTTALGLSALYYWRATSQGDIVPKPETLHKCLNCGQTITMGTTVCPYCGSKTLF
jgi:rRNA maturation endonuclease Nob1